MVRDYEDGTKDGVKYFIGTEVEDTVVKGHKTLFITGVPNIDEIAELLHGPDCKGIKHIYFGANQSFNVRKWDEFRKWEEVIAHFLILDYWCTLDFDVKLIEIINESALKEYQTFVPMISVKLPYAMQLGYNATIKIDDTDFSHSNPGVWCHQLHDLMSRDKFTSWDKYKDDIVLGD